MFDHFPWRYAGPHTVVWHIEPSHIDHYNHVNNGAYVNQLEALAWSHSNALGLTFKDYQDHDRGMVIRRHEIDYLMPCHIDDEIVCGTWITFCDNKLNLVREFEFYCTRRQKKVFAAKTEFICVSLSTGAPKRMPEHFKHIYGKACIGRDG